MSDAARPLAIVADVHGEASALSAALAHYRGRRHVVLVGDYVNRGPSSAAVVELVADAVGQGEATALMGNHDWAFRDYIRCGDLGPFARLGGLATLNSYVGAVDDPHEALLAEIPLPLATRVRRAVRPWRGSRDRVGRWGFRSSDLPELRRGRSARRVRPCGVPCPLRRVAAGSRIRSFWVLCRPLFARPGRPARSRCRGGRPRFIAPRRKAPDRGRYRALRPPDTTRCQGVQPAPLPPRLGRRCDRRR